jgi:hypothetical protein
MQPCRYLWRISSAFVCSAGGGSLILAVAENQRPAKFRIAATLATQLDPATSSEKALWAELERLTPTFRARWQAIRADWGEDYSICHLVMPHHVECCTYPVLEWIAEHVSAAPVNVMEQFHPDNFCDPASDKYREKYDEIARRPTYADLHASWQRAHELGLKFETTTFERDHTLDAPDLFGVLKMFRSGCRSAYKVQQQLSQTQKSLSCFGRCFSACDVRSSLLSHDFHNYPLVPLPIKLGIKIHCHVPRSSLPPVMGTMI